MQREQDPLPPQPLAHAMELLQAQVAALPEQERLAIQTGLRAVAAAAAALEGQREQLASELDQLRGQLLTERAWLDSILHQMPSGLSVAQAPSGRLLLHNDTAVRLLGHPMHESPDYRGYAQYGAEHPDGSPYEPEEYPIARALHGELVTQEELRYRRGDGVVTYFSVNAAPVYGSDGTIIAAVSTFDDIAAQKRAEAELAALYATEREARARAEEAALVRESFLAIAAHELRTPVAAIHGFAQLLERRLRTRDNVEERDRRAVDTIKGQAERTNRLIESLLDVSRLKQGAALLPHEPIDLCALTERVVEEMQPLLEQHRLSYSCDASAVLVEGDPLRLEQVFQNLIQNAVKYSPAGGRVEVQLARQGDSVIWKVHDQGIGVPSSARGQLFERFYRAENAMRLPVGGMGVGLYIVQELVALHGGLVEVSSERGRGTTFTVRLPLASAA